MVEEILQKSYEIKREGALTCLILFLLGNAMVGGLLLTAYNTNLTEVLQHTLPTEQIQETTIPEKPENLKPLFSPPPKVITKKVYTERAAHVGEKINKIKQSLHLNKNSKLEFILARGVQEGLIHPVEADQILEEYALLSSTDSNSWK